MPAPFMPRGWDGSLLPRRRHRRTLLLVEPDPDGGGHRARILDVALEVPVEPSATYRKQS